LRTLTLGLLVASGGILAALPFRRYPEIGNSSITHVTGPTESPLDAAHVAASWKIDPVVPSRLQFVTVPAAAEQASEQASERPWPTQVAPPPRRRADVPLSLADLAQPIDQPNVMDEQFNATAKVHQQQLEHERKQLVMPEINSLDESQREEIQSATTAAPLPTATASLASTARREAPIELIPKSAPTERDRHWIRQPE
jgi:hypothetical protein